ncbi:heparinase II/III family protein [Sporofaciens musculi]|uniref:heparinase II/III family protein n=2 Tax=Sporofaciens musculi TaxID=2681861 RepID=UPI0025853AD6|nr:alginate lyase family protein [Sporofaciens musculi]
MRIVGKCFRYFNTVKYLKTSQIFYQVHHKRKRKKDISQYSVSEITFSPYQLFIETLDGEPDYADRFELEQLVNGTLKLLHESTHFPYGTWNLDEKSHLWNFNLHYLEYCVALVSKYRSTGETKYKETIENILKDWLDYGLHASDAVNAYTISLRLVNCLIVLSVLYTEMDKALKKRLILSLYSQYRWLLCNTEKHLLGNHYLENLKAIVIGSLYFGEENIYHKYVNMFLQELNEQILPDGFHFELSVMYHKIILEDLIRVGLVLKETERTEYRQVVQYIEKMCSALKNMEDGISRTPLFNDSGDNIAKSSSSLLGTSEILFGLKMKRLSKNIYLKESGYYRYNRSNYIIIIDCGRIGPDYIPGHGQCDCLSYELYLNQLPFIVNSGTYQYQGRMRKYFRSVYAHNTVVIDGKEQSEVWGEHRVARRISSIIAKPQAVSFEGGYRAYHGGRHSRFFDISDAGIRILDYVSNVKEGCSIQSFVHLSPGVTAEFERNAVALYMGNKKAAILNPIECNVHIHRSGWLCNYAPDFGKLETGVCLEFIWLNDRNSHGYTLDFINI